MAQPGSIQREPTMEEILASIRRIIEDSDPDAPKAPESRQASAETAPAEPVATLAQAAANDETVAEVESFRRDMEWDEPAAPDAPHAAGESDAARSEAPAAPKSLADVQASLKKEPPQARPEPVEEAEAPVTIAEARFETVADNAFEVVADADEAERLQAEDAPPATAGGETRPSIISEQAGRQVTAAFEELSEAFAANRKRSFDEMAEELIRPMLREWMDNNLPVLVERLVREEIERVARGA